MNPNLSGPVLEVVVKKSEGRNWKFEVVEFVDESLVLDYIKGTIDVEKSGDVAVSCVDFTIEEGVILQKLSVISVGKLGDSCDHCFF